MPRSDASITRSRGSEVSEVESMSNRDTAATEHSERSVRTGCHFLDWENHPYEKHDKKEPTAIALSAASLT